MSLPDFCEISALRGAHNFPRVPKTQAEKKIVGRRAVMKSRTLNPAKSNRFFFFVILSSFLIMNTSSLYFVVFRKWPSSPRLYGPFSESSLLPFALRLFDDAVKPLSFPSSNLSVYHSFIDHLSSHIFILGQTFVWSQFSLRVFSQPLLL